MTHTSPFAPGDEVTITITGRVIHTDQHGATGIEYIKDNGFPDRIIVRTGPTVTVTAAPPPSADELTRREHAAQIVTASRQKTQP